MTPLKLYYLHNIPMKGNTTFFGVKRRIRLLNASREDVWKSCLSFSTSFSTLLLHSTFYNFVDCQWPCVITKLLSVIVNLLIQESNSIYSIINIVGCNMKQTSVLKKCNAETTFFLQQVPRWNHLIWVRWFCKWMFTLGKDGIVVSVHILEVVDQWSPLSHLLWSWSGAPVNMISDATLPLPQQSTVLAFSQFL